MKKIFVLMLLVSLVCGLGQYAYASDWDAAGKVLTGIEGLRILTGGKVDVIGNIAGIARDKRDEGRCYTYYRKEHLQRVWVPHFVWEKRWVPKHKEFGPRGRAIIVKGHYVKYRIQRGGHWEYR